MVRHNRTRGLGLHWFVDCLKASLKILLHCLLVWSWKKKKNPKQTEILSCNWIGFQLFWENSEEKIVVTLNALLILLTKLIFKSLRCAVCLCLGFPLLWQIHLTWLDLTSYPLSNLGKVLPNPSPSIRLRTKNARIFWYCCCKINTFIRRNTIWLC